MTGSRRWIDWAALGANVGLAVLFALLASAPFLVGADVGLWLIAAAVGVVVGVFLYLRRDRYSEPGPDADETRFPRDG
jgi:ADP-heptose:LPS heptosyltransferase